MIHGILWDNDGVLVDTEHLFFTANKELLNSYGMDLSESDFFNWYLIRNIGSWHLFQKAGMTEKDLPLIRKKRSEIYNQKLLEAKDLAIDGIRPILQQLHKKVPMGIVTSAYRHHFDTIHAHLNLRDYFDFVLTNEDYEGSKPSPAPYLCGLNKIGLPASQCVVIEDSPRGLAAAQAAGIRCIIMRHKLMKTFHFKGAYKVVNNTNELGEVIQNLLG